jgi:hypothetical protein
MFGFFRSAAGAAGKRRSAAGYDVENAVGWLLVQAGCYELLRPGARAAGEPTAAQLSLTSGVRLKGLYTL